MSGTRFNNDGGLEYRVRELERLMRRQEEVISQLERSRYAQWIGGGGDGDRVEGFYLNDQLNARAGCDGYGPTVSATVLDDDGELTSETIQLGDIIMSPGDFVAAGSKGFMRLRNDEWKIIVPYCKPSGETSPPAPIIEPNPGDPDLNWPASTRYSSYQHQVAVVMSATPAWVGDMTSEGEELP